MKSFTGLAAFIAGVLTALPSAATELRFENVKLPLARELDGLQSVAGYGDNVTGVSTGGFTNSYAKGNGWTPNIVLDFSAGNDRKTVSSWRDSWDGGDGANYLLDGDDGGPYYYWYTFTPRGGGGVVINVLDLDGVGENQNRIDWKIHAESKVGKVLASGSTGSFSGDRQNLDLGMQKPHFGVVILELVHTGSRTTLAVDNLNFDEAPPAANPNKSNVVQVGLRKQLLVDDHVIAETSGVTRELGKVTKLNGGGPVFEGHFYGTVLFDEGKFKLWYRGNPYGYAESKDGLQFRKVAKLAGLDPAHHNTASVYIDPHETDPAHRYKICYAYLRPHAAALAYSADGIHWKPYNNGKPVTHRAADTYNQIVWDEEAKVYRLFTRTDYRRPPDGLEVRGTRDMINPDIKANPTNWRTVREWKFGKGPADEVYRRQIYALTDWIYEGVHFALMSVYEFIPKPGEPYDRVPNLVKRHEHDIVNFYIGTARGNAMWDLTWVYASKPMIPRGPDGSFDKDMIFPASQIVTHKDKHWIYYNGYRERHGIGDRGKHGIGLATLELDRLIGLAAKGDRWGTIVTKPFKLCGDKLQVNVAGGEFQVEVLNKNGDPLPGFSAKESTKYKDVDELRLVPTWKNNLSTLKGRTIRLRFQLGNSKLYSFQILE
ncbi:MAG: hypothetical protein VB835_11590 [Pirellulales bacterium]